MVGLGEKLEAISDGDHVIVDGEQGEIVINPNEAERASYNEKIQKQKELAAHYAQLKDLEAVTTDGVKVELMANIGSHMDVDNALTYGAQGVGIFRSEFVFMGREDIPNEEDQFKAYKEAIEKCKGGLCVIRTMDIGGDKPLPYLSIPKEENHFNSAVMNLIQRTTTSARVKEKIRSISSIKAKEILADVMNMEDGDEIKAYLSKVL